MGRIGHGNKGRLSSEDGGHGGKEQCFGSVHSGKG